MPTTCFNCESACGLLAYVDKDSFEIRKFEGNPYHPGSRPQAMAIELSVGPIQDFWRRQEVFDFYRQAAECPAEIIYLGETVCSKRRELKRSQDEFRDDLNIRRNEVLSKLQKVMYEATVSLAKEQGFDVILGQGVVYSSDRVDITDKVLKKLATDFKSGS